MFAKILALLAKLKPKENAVVDSILGSAEKEKKVRAFLKTKGINPTTILALIQAILKFLPEILALFSKKPA